MINDGSDWSIYILQAVCIERPFKIGRSRNVRRRLRDLQDSNPFQLKLLADFVCGEQEIAADAESCMHRRLDRFHLRGEWFLGEAEPFVMAAIEVMRDRPRGESAREALRRNHWSGDLIDETSKRSESRRRAREARERRRSRRRPRSHRSCCQHSANAATRHNPESLEPDPNQYVSCR